jgi:hypothetical protein
VITPGVYNIEAFAGATFDRTFSLAVAGVPVDLTSYSAAMQVREAVDSVSPLISLTSGSGIVLGGTAGTIQVNISASTMGVAQGSYCYDLEITSGSVVSRVLQGSFNVSGNVTR